MADGRDRTDDRPSLAAAPPPSTKPGIAVGTAGFSYPDWIGPVYDRATAGGGRALATVARWTDLLEVNVSHYRIPAPRLAASWLAATSGRADFRFTAKLHRGYTHGPQAPTRADHAAMRAFLDALGADGRLIAVLAQFPPSLHASPRALAYVLRLADHFAGIPLAVEFRHASWDADDVREALRGVGAAWVVGDWTPGPGWIEPAPWVTSALGYVRLHGRSAAWYERGVGRDRRYDYLYAPEELAAWVERIRRMSAAAAAVVVVANNHFGGQAVANALELKSLLAGAPVPGPASLVAAFPRLAARVRIDSAPTRVDRPDTGWFNPAT